MLLSKISVSNQFLQLVIEVTITCELVIDGLGLTVITDVFRQTHRDCDLPGGYRFFLFHTVTAAATSGRLSPPIH